MLYDKPWGTAKRVPSKWVHALFGHGQTSYRGSAPWIRRALPIGLLEIVMVIVIAIVIVIVVVVVAVVMISHNE